MEFEPHPVESLIKRAKRGDRQAFCDIVRMYQQPIRAWAAAHCFLGGDPDDVAQKTFLAAYHRLTDFKTGTNFRAWLFTIARYQMMTESTRSRRLADYHNRFAPDLLDRELERRVKEEPPELVVQRLKALHQCVEGLSDASQKLLKWRYYEAIPLSEMAERTERSVGAIKKQLFLIRQKLQSCINAQIPDTKET